MKKQLELISLNDLANNPENKFVVVAIDETEYWHDDIQKAAGKIEGVYLVDLTSPTHCCELSVSYPAIHIKNFFSNIFGFTEDELTELENQELREDYLYLSGSSAFEPLNIYTSGTFEEAEENEQCNPTVC